MEEQSTSGGTGDRAHKKRMGSTNPTFTCTQGLFQMLVILLPEIIPCFFSLKLANITKLSGWCTRRRAEKFCGKRECGGK